ncbi:MULTISPECIES: hypothetical protein [Bacillus cereus group]|uniref:hypothetical protein n=1 Tax=Bacillus cereus group TaxID=86661 RepID=UPI000DCA783C|nr:MULTISPECIES: hypothetical protein [Bacillus cereus group]MED1286391.1 hypothetical protein [Bacillus mycoides]RAS98593.1 hypothetical protein A6E25_22120 [Bacillus cereus]
MNKCRVCYQDSKGKCCDKCKPFWKISRSAYRRCIPYDNEKARDNAKKAGKKLRKAYHERWGFHTNYDKGITEMAQHIRDLWICPSYGGSIDNPLGNKCYYTRQEMCIPGEGDSMFSLSPDRKNPNGKYDKDNIVLSLAIINRMKTTFVSEKDLYEACLNIVQVYWADQVRDNKIEEQGVKDTINRLIERLKNIPPS